MSIRTERWVTGSVITSPAPPTPYTGPLAYRWGLRLSVAISSCTIAIGSPQPHIVSTRLRSCPCGRGGAGGTWPAAMRSVQSANRPSARSRPMRFNPAFMLGPLRPTWTRWSQASRVESKSSMSSIGISRVATLPIWWQSWQPSLSRSTHSAWCRIARPMPLPSGPVPGNSLAAGTSSSEYQ